MGKNISDAKTNDDKDLEPLFSLEELVEAIENVIDNELDPIREEGWITVREYAVTRGITEQMARDRLKKAVINGLLEQKVFRDPANPNPKKRNQSMTMFRPKKE